MVRTGYSKGCGTCRKRKIKCDEGKPACKRCLKANPPRECEGYARSFEFIIGGKASGGAVHRPSQQASREASKETSQSSRPAFKIEDSSDSFNRLVSVAMSRNPSPMSDDTLFGFVVNGVLAASPEYVDYNWRSFFGVQFDAGPKCVAYFAARLVAMTYFARLHGNEKRYLDRAEKEYGHALLWLRDSIDDPDTQFDPANIATAIALQHYEALMYTSRLAWLQHAGGAARLIEMRGPHRHTEFPAHGYFLMARSGIVGQALFTRTSTFLDREEWKTIPWTIHPWTKNYHQQLVDIITSIPSLMASFRSASTIAVSESDLHNLSARFAPMIKDLISQTILWRWAFEKARPGIGWEAPCSPTESYTLNPHTSEPFYPTVYHFTDLGLAHLINFYHSVTGILLMFSSTINQPLLFQQTLTSLLAIHSPPEPTNPFPLPTSAATTPTLATIAHALARTVDFYLLPQHAYQGAYSLLMPIRGMVLAFTILNEVDRVGWAIDLGKRVVGKSMGYEVSKGLVGLRIPGLEGEELPEVFKMRGQGIREETVRAAKVAGG